MRTAFRQEEVPVYQPPTPSLLKRVLRAVTLAMLLLLVIMGIIAIGVYYQRVKAVGPVSTSVSPLKAKTCSYVADGKPHVVDEHEIRFGTCE